MAYIKLPDEEGKKIPQIAFNELHAVQKPKKKHKNIDTVD